MFNGIPIIGWAISLFFSISFAVPFWFCWTYCELGELYFSFLPPVYQHIPFWNCVGLFTIIVILKAYATSRWGERRDFE